MPADRKRKLSYFVSHGPGTAMICLPLFLEFPPTLASFERWREYDPVLFALVDKTRKGHLGKMERCKADAADRGDWRAAHSVLETAPETRDAYQSTAPGAITFIVNVQRATREDAEAAMRDITPVTIEG